MFFSCGAPPDPHAGHNLDAGLDAGTNAVADAGAVDAGLSDAGVADAGAVDAGPADAGVAVGTPILTSVSEVSHGTVQISWLLPASGCSSVGLALKVGSGGTFSDVKSVSGTATTTQDAPGHVGTFCYRVVCTLNGASSAPSNEKCVTL